MRNDEIILAKNRNGPVDDVYLRFREEKAQFTDMEDIDFEGMQMNPEDSSFTIGSKMNNDDLSESDSGFEQESPSDDDAPFF